MSAGEFTDRARAAILDVCDGRCAGCLHGRPLTCQHRRARGRGGTSDSLIGHPGNGVPLCGSGTTGCHGWAEHHPTDAALLGWRLTAGDDPLIVPLWLAPYGWREYRIPSGRFLDHVYAEVGHRQEAALGRFLAQLEGPRLPAWLRPPKGNR